MYVAGDYLTYVDFDIAELLLRFIALAKKMMKVLNRNSKLFKISLLDNYPNINKFLTNVLSLP